MKEYNVSNVVHLECDAMIYIDLEQVEPIFIKHYDGLGVTFDNDERVVPGLVFIRNHSALDSFSNFVADLGGEVWDMHSLAQFKEFSQGKLIQHLPILPPSYAAEYPLMSLMCASGQRLLLITIDYDDDDSN